MGCKRRATWRNHTGNQSCQPLLLCEPQGLDDITVLVSRAETAGVTVRAVGSGHSWSDVALTGGLLLRPEGLAGDELEFLPGGDRGDGRRLVRVLGGTRIRELNALLWDEGYALPNMGGYDGQTICGVISTSTHGSGLRHGPLCDLVRSIDLVGSGGGRHRIEPADGPTDPDRPDPGGEGWQLTKDDELFAAALVGMGCLGVIYAVVLEVRASFLLHERRETSSWKALRDGLASGELPPRDDRHWELLVNPYPRKDGDHTVVITTRSEPPPGHDPEGHERRRPFVTELLASIPLTHGVMNLVLDLDPDGTPEAIDHALENLADEYTDRSYRVFNIGAANLLPAYSSEIAVPLTGGTPVRAVEAVFAVAARHRDVGDAYATSPFALRFVRRSPALLSMMHGRDTMMIELIMQTDTEGGFELLAAYERALYAHGGRPHWGQFNVLTERRVEALYGENVARWRSAAELLDPSGVFAGPFAYRVGLR